MATLLRITGLQLTQINSKSSHVGISPQKAQEYLVNLELFPPIGILFFKQFLFCSSVYDSVFLRFSGN